jgi:predicted ATP-grasp superfamily ATP-dependent carboligase
MSERVLITGVRAPAALDIARSLKAAGFEVHMADCVPARIARWSCAPTAVHRHASPVREPARFATDMRGLLDRLDPTAVIPTCEEVFHLSALAEADGWSDRVIAPPMDRLTRLHHKGQFADLCQTLGLSVPNSTTATDADALMMQATRGQVVVKPAWSRFGSRTLIGPTPRQLARLSPSHNQSWIVQDRVQGEEVSLYAMAHEGQVSAFCAYRSDWRTRGGAAYVFEPLTGLVLDRLRDIASTLASFVGTGQFGCDAIVDAKDQPWLIECNPRATSGVHLFRRSAEFGRALLGRGIADPAPDDWRNGVMLDSVGLVEVLRTRRLSKWRTDRGRSKDIVSATGDPLPPLGAVMDAAGFGMQALASGRGLAETMTADIEWNGQPLTPALWEGP